MAVRQPSVTAHAAENLKKGFPFVLLKKDDASYLKFK